MTDKIYDVRLCPLCGKKNFCQPAESNENCWCKGKSLSEYLAAEIPSDLLEAVCLCENCAGRQSLSPCVGTCELDPSYTVCLGCQRTRSEISSWPRLDFEDKLAILKRLNAD